MAASICTPDLPYLNFDLNQVRFFDKVWHEAEPDWMQAWQQMLMLYSKQGYMEDPLFGRRSGGLQEGKKNEVVNYPVLACEAAVMAIAEQRVLETFIIGTLSGSSLTEEAGPALGPVQSILLHTGPLAIDMSDDIGQLDYRKLTSAVGEVYSRVSAVD